MMGKTVGSIRRVCIVVPAGSCGRICPISALTCSMAATMSVPQSNEIDTSALPRLVVERTSSTFGTLCTACSIGAVTCSTICSAGRSPASMLRRTRGNCTLGKSVTGNEKAAARPAVTGSSSKNSSDRRCVAIQAVNMSLLGTRHTFAHRHVVVQLVIAGGDDLERGIERARNFRQLVGFDAALDFDTLGAAIRDLEDVAALVVAQHGVARHDPAFVLGQDDGGRHCRS